MVKYFLVLLQVYTSKIGCLLMKKSFQLSAVAIAIAASSSVMADAFVIQDTDQTGNVYNTYTIDTDSLNSVAANTVTGQLVVANQLFVAGQDIGQKLDQEIIDRVNGDAATLVNANAYSDAGDANTLANANAYSDAGDANTLANANAYSDAGDVNTLASANAYTDGQVTAEKTAREAADAAIRNDIATSITTGRINGNGTDGALVLHGGTNSTTQTLNDNGVSFVTTNAQNVVTGTTTIDASGKLTAASVATTNLTATNATVDNLTVKNGLTIVTSATAPVQGVPQNSTTNPATTQVYLASNPANTTGKDIYAIYDDVTKGYKYYNATGPLGASNQTYTEITDTSALANLPLTGDYTGQTTNTTITQQNSNKEFSVNNTKTSYSNTTTKDTTVKINAGGKVVNTTDPLPKSVEGTGLASTEELSKRSVDTGIIGTDAVGDVYGVVATDKQGNTTNTTTLTGKGLVTTGNVTAKTITLDGADLATTITNGDAATLTSAKDYTDTKVGDEKTAREVADTQIRTDFAAADAATLTSAKDYTDTKVGDEKTAREAADTQIRTDFAAADAATLTSAKDYTDTKVGDEKTAREAADTQIRTDFAAADAATLTSAKDYTDTKVGDEKTAREVADTQIRTDFAAADAQIRTDFAAADTATLNTAKGYTDTTATTLRSEAAAETVRVNKAIVDGDAATLTSAKGYTDTKSAATLASANAYTDGRANQLNTRIDDVQRTAYRGIAISLAAQQAVPSIGPGQVAIFGGVGHYEGETAGSIGVVTAFTDRLSASGAFGFAGGNEFGGRVGVAYVFGGK
jgi:hypothetical protein